LAAVRFGAWFAMDFFARPTPAIRSLGVFPETNGQVVFR
jgi:hypothetical protein